jgi:hypothetical protein
VGATLIGAGGSIRGKTESAGSSARLSEQDGGQVHAQITRLIRLYRQARVFLRIGTVLRCIHSDAPIRVNIVRHAWPQPELSCAKMARGPTRAGYVPVTTGILYCALEPAAVVAIRRVPAIPFGAWALICVGEA